MVFLWVFLCFFIKHGDFPGRFSSAMVQPVTGDLQELLEDEDDLDYPAHGSIRKEQTDV